MGDWRVAGRGRSVGRQSHDADKQDEAARDFAAWCMQIAGSVSEKCPTMMVGAMVVARLVNDSALSNEILTVAASAFGGHTNSNQKRNAK